MAFGLAETAKLAVDLSLKGNFSSALAANQRALTSFNAKITDSQGRAYKAGQQIGTGLKAGAVIAAGAFGVLATQVAAGLHSLAQLDDVVAQTNAVLTSTKNVAGQTAASIRNLAEKYEGLNATIDDKVIQSGENLLLTFTNIRKEGFEPALKAALDMNQALGRGESGLTDTVRALGRALNDPAKGLVLLTRLGVNFTDAQKDQIKAALEANDTLKAQSIIIAELNKRFGGSFLAGGNTTTGKIAKIRDAIEDLQRALADGLLPVLTKGADKLAVFLNDPKVIGTIKQLGQSLARVFSDRNLAEGGKILGSLFDTAVAAAPVIGAAAKATLTAVKAAVSLFTSLPKELQQLAIGAFAINKITGGLVTNIAGGLIDAVLKKVAAVVNVQGAVVNVNGAGGVGGAVAGGASRVGRVLSAVGKVFLVGAAVGVFAELKGILDDQSRRNKEQEKGLNQQTNDFIKVAGIDDLKTALAGIEAQEKRLNNSWEGDGFAFRLNIDGVRDAIEEEKRALEAAILKLASDTHSEGVTIEHAITAQQQALQQVIADQKDRDSSISASFHKFTTAVTNAISQSGGGNASAPGVGENVFVPEVKLDPTQVIDVRDVTHRAWIEAIKDAGSSIRHQTATTSRGLATVGARVNAARVATTAAGARAAAASRATTAAVKDKDLSVAVNIGPTNISLRDVTRATIRARQFGRTIQ